MFSLSLSPVKEAIRSLCSESAGAGAGHRSDGHQAATRQLGLYWPVNYHVTRYQCKATVTKTSSLCVGLMGGIAN